LGIKIKKAVIFGSSAPVEGDEDYKEAYEIGRALAENGFAVVNGGYMGIMEATAKGAKSANGKTIGITTDALNYVEPNPFLDEEIRTKNLAERITKGIEIGDVFIILKGSTGTMQELMEVWNLMKLKLVPRRPIICYGSHYRDIIAKIENVGKHKSVKVEENLISFAENIEELKRILKE
jgi:uncharacterized protein (TIGR00730 family)